MPRRDPETSKTDLHDGLPVAAALKVDEVDLRPHSHRLLGDDALGRHLGEVDRGLVVRLRHAAEAVGPVVVAAARVGHVVVVGAVEPVLGADDLAVVVPFDLLERESLGIIDLVMTRMSEGKANTKHLVIVRLSLLPTQWDFETKPFGKERNAKFGLKTLLETSMG